MKILHVTKKYPNAIGGDATCLDYMEKLQKKAGHLVYILAANCRELAADDNVFRFGFKDSAHNWDRVTLKRILSLFLLFIQSLIVIQRTKPDIIHSHSADIGFIVSIWAKGFGIPVVNTCHSISFPHKHLGRLKRYPELFCLRFGFFRRILTVDENSMEIFRRYHIKNIGYLPIAGVDLKQFESVKRLIAPADKEEGLVFLFVGRLDPLKGVHYLLQAASTLSQSIQNLKIWIVGGGACKKELELLSGQLNISHAVTFFGEITSRTQLMRLYCMADAFVLPSLLECFPLTILEAWAAGLAVIATRVGGIERRCLHENNAMIIPAGDSDALSSCMKRLATDSALRKNLGENGRKTVIKFEWENIVKRLDEFYQEIIHG